MPRRRLLLASPNRLVRRGQIWWVSWEPGRGSEQHGRRLALVIQSNAANEVEAYGLTIVLAMSTGGHQDNLLHVAVEPSKLNGLSQRGVVRCEQILTISKARLDGYIGQIEPRLLAVIEQNVRDILSL